MLGRGWGLRALANGRGLASYKDDFKLAAIAFHNVGMIDEYDIETIQKSNLYDITPGYVSIGIPLDARFKQELIDGLHGTNYKLLIVPNGIRDAQLQNAAAGREVGRESCRVWGWSSVNALGGCATSRRVALPYPII